MGDAESTLQHCSRTHDQGRAFFLLCQFNFALPPLLLSRANLQMGKIGKREQEKGNNASALFCYCGNKKQRDGGRILLPLSSVIS